MHDAMLVAVRYTLDKLVHEALQPQHISEQVPSTPVLWGAVLLQIMMMLSMEWHQG